MEQKPFKKGKVRDLYDLNDRIFMVASDRISAFDCVFNEPIPTKGIILNSISRFFFEYTKDIIDNHLITAEFEDFRLHLMKMNILKVVPC